MSEVKRAKLISFDANRVDSANFGRTVRISVILPESTEDNCPEYNYKDELVAAKRKTTTKKEDGESKKAAVNGLSSFDEEDDNDVKRIAAEMEAKYGVAGNKKRKFRKDDYADIGMGYDESDSFIDNTDGYDEIIPKNVTTLHGGFYINCGALEFKADENLSSNNSSSSEESEEDDEEEEEAGEKLNTRVRKLESSTESENEVTTTTSTTTIMNTNNIERKKHLIKKQKLMMNTTTTVMQKAIKKRLFSHDKIKQYKRNKNEEYKKTVRELLKERRDDVVVSIPVEEEKKVESTPIPILKENKKPAILASVDNVIESVINKTVQNKIEPCHNDVAKTNNSEPHSSNEVVINNKVDFGDVKTVEIVQLPQNLPSDIVDIIESIKKAAANSTEGKVKFFTGHVNTMLLNLESKCKCLGKHSRLKVYEHLAPFVKCKKETLIKRAKNLCVIEEQKKIKNLLERLKIIVSQTMPELVKNYEKETSLVLQKKFSAQGDEASKSLRMPKRQFLWNEEAKKLLRDAMTLQKKCFLLEGKQKELIEAHLSDFLKSDILTIWPEGWMSLNSLLKYCSNILDIKKKITIPPKKPTSEPASIVVTTPSNIISSNPAVTITPVTTSSTLKISVLPDEVLFSKTNVNKTLPDAGSAKYVPISSSKTEVPDVILIEESPSKEKTIDRDKDHFQIIDLTDQSNRKSLPKPKFYNSPPKQPKPKEPPISFERPMSHTKEEMNCSSAITQIIADSLRQSGSSNISKSNALISEDNKKFPNASSSNDYARTFQNSDGDDIMKVMENLKVLQKMSSPIKSESTNSSPVSVIAYNKSSHDPNITGAAQSIQQQHRSSSFQDAFQKKFIPDFLKATQNASATTSTSKQQGNGSNSFYKYNNSTSIKNSERYLQNNTNNNYAQHIYNKLKTQQSVEDSLDLLFGNFINDRNHSRTGNSKSNAPHK